MTVTLKTAAPAAADAEALKRAMRTLVGGVSVITAGVGEARTGATVTSATALSMDPPTMIASLNLSSSTWPVLREAGAFAINILAPEQTAIAERFAGRGGLKGAARYAGADWIGLVTGAPVLVGALAAIDCTLEEAIERHSHAILIGRVRAVTVIGGTSLAYAGGRFARLEG